MSIDRLDAAPFNRALSLFGLDFRSEGLTGKIIALDICERVLIASIYGSFMWRMLLAQKGTPDVTSVLIVLSEALPFLFVILRAPTATLSQRPSDWLVALIGTTAPLLVSPPANPVGPIGPIALAYGVMLFGLCLQIAAKAVLGRAFGIVAANRGVRELGPYRIMRHPMYAGYTLTHVGFLLAFPSWENATIYFFALILQVVRIAREERVLMRDPIYATFAKRVRYRLLPGIY